MKGRKVPPSEDDNIRSAIARVVTGTRDAGNIAYASLEGMLLDRTALRQWQTVFDKIVSYRGMIAPGQLEFGCLEYLYLFRAGDLYKIGVTQDIPKRIKSLQTGNPHPISLVSYMILIQGSGCEKLMHEWFQHGRMSGEWFALSEEEVSTIRGWFRNGIPSKYETP